MKRKILSIALILASGLPVMAQSGEKKNELSIGVGFSSGYMNFMKSIIKEIDAVLSNKDLSEDVNAMKQSGFFASYKRYIGKRAAIGGTLFLKSLEKERTVNSVCRKYRQHYYGLAVEGTYDYYQSRNFNVYGLAGASAYACDVKYSTSGDDNAESANHDDTFIKVAFQLSPVGLRIGNDWGVKIEAGYGYKGIVSSELFVRF